MEMLPDSYKEQNLLNRVIMFMIICCISGKSGCRRIVPGQYLAIDPKGRAVMIGAVEKQKLVYILNRDSNVRVPFALLCNL